eukprot:6127482-Pleurochrysis_carterae.AAC.2
MAETSRAYHCRMEESARAVPQRHRGFKRVCLLTPSSKMTKLCTRAAARRMRLHSADGLRRSSTVHRRRALCVCLLHFVDEH